MIPQWIIILFISLGLYPLFCLLNYGSLEDYTSLKIGILCLPTALGLYFEYKPAIRTAKVICWIISISLIFFGILPLFSEKATIFGKLTKPTEIFLFFTIPLFLVSGFFIFVKNKLNND